MKRSKLKVGSWVVYTSLDVNSKTFYHVGQVAEIHPAKRPDIMFERVQIEGHRQQGGPNGWVIPEFIVPDKDGLRLQMAFANFNTYFKNAESALTSLWYEHKDSLIGHLTRYERFPRELDKAHQS